MSKYITMNSIISLVIQLIFKANVNKYKINWHLCHVTLINCIWKYDYIRHAICNLRSKLGEVFQKGRKFKWAPNLFKKLFQISNIGGKGCKYQVFGVKKKTHSPDRVHMFLSNATRRKQSKTINLDTSNEQTK